VKQITKRSYIQERNFDKVIQFGNSLRDSLNERTTCDESTAKGKEKYIGFRALYHYINKHLG